MTEATGLTIGAEASCSDGFCGEVSRVIMDPLTTSVTHLVVKPKHRRQPGRLVPIGLVDAAASGAGGVRLRCTIAQFGELEPSEESDLEQDSYGGGGSQGVYVTEYGNAGLIGGVGPGAGPSRRVVVHDAVPLGDVEVSRGEHVHALDGHIGQVHGFVINAGDHHVTHVLLEEGHLWGRKEVAIPVSAIVGVDDGVRLNISKKEVEELPPAS